MKKVEVMMRMANGAPNPSELEAVRRLQGMMAYLAKFLPLLSSIMEPVRRLTRQDCNWEWGEEHETAMNQLKSRVTTAPLLAYPAMKLTIQCDASSSGLGAALMQEGKPLAYAIEVGYAQIEMLCLAIVLSLERFHQYILLVEKQRYTPTTSHLSLLSRGPLHKAPKRIQDMLLRLLQYDIEVTYRSRRCT